MIAAILAAAMSNLSSSLNALASTTVVDFYRPFIKKDASAGSQLLISRWLTVAWGIILTLLAIKMRNIDKSVLEKGLTIASISSGSMLGVFLLGVLTKRANEKGSLIGMAIGFLSIVAVWQFTTIAFTWYVLMGTVITFCCGYLASFFFAGAQPNYRAGS